MSPPFALSDNGFLGHKIQLLQPQEGYRVAIDPVFLAASVPVRPFESVLDLGSGVGAVSCFLLSREPSLQITGVEKNRDVLEIAIENHARNGFSASFHPEHNSVTDLKLLKQFDHLVTNPPFYSQKANTLAQSELKAEAHQRVEGLQEWLMRGLSHLKSGGILTLILPPLHLGNCIQVLEGKVGDLKILPLWPKPMREAVRLIVQGRKGAKGGAKIFPGLVLHEQSGGYTKKAEEILKGAPLSFSL